MSESAIKIPGWFKVVAIVAFIWNLLGVAAYLIQVTMSEEAMAALPPEQAEVMMNTPAWATAGYALAVWFGALGTLMLILKRKLATPILVVSLIGIVIQQYHSFFVIDAVEIYGATAAIFPMIVLIVGLYLPWLSRSATAKGWLK